MSESTDQYPRVRDDELASHRPGGRWDADPEQRFYAALEHYAPGQPYSLDEADALRAAGFAAVNHVNADHVRLTTRTGRTVVRTEAQLRALVLDYLRSVAAAQAS